MICLDGVAGLINQSARTECVLTEGFTLDGDPFFVGIDLLNGYLVPFSSRILTTAYLQLRRVGHGASRVAEPDRYRVFELNVVWRNADRNKKFSAISKRNANRVTLDGPNLEDNGMVLGHSTGSFVLEDEGRRLRSYVRLGMRAGSNGAHDWILQFLGQCPLPSPLRLALAACSGGTNCHTEPKLFSFVRIRRPFS